MADLNLKKLVDKEILAFVLKLFKQNFENGVNDKGYLNTAQVQALINTYGFQNETQVANTVSAEIAKVVGGAPETFDTLKEIADWIGDNENVDSILELIGKKVDKDELETTLEDYVKTTDLTTTLGDYLTKTDAADTYVTKVQLNALEMTEAEAEAIVNEVFAPEESNEEEE